MADCYYHGYSGGPGACEDCARERREGLDQGSIAGDNEAAREVVRGPAYHPDATVRQPRKRKS